MTSGRVLATHWAYYMHIARVNRDETRAVLTADANAFLISAIVAIIMSALAVEAFINELAEAADMAHINRHGLSSPALAKLHELAVALQAIESDRGSVKDKYQEAYRVLSGAAFSRGQAPYQWFKQLIDLRNLMVHLKPGDQHSPTGHIEPSEPIVRYFQKAGYTRTRGRRAGDPLGGMSWLQEIQTVKMADWAYSAACSIIAAIGDVIPTDPPRTAGIDQIKRATRDIYTWQ